jgi:sn-glycerol 3-phosphate transport system substrate-binding protein
MQELSNQPPLPWTRGLRLGYLPQLRQIQRNALEAVLAGKQTPQAALQHIVRRGDALLERFGESAGSEP